MIGCNWRVASPEICFAASCTRFCAVDIHEIAFDFWDDVITHIPAGSVLVIVCLDKDCRFLATPSPSPASSNPNPFDVSYRFLAHLLMKRPSTCPSNAFFEERLRRGLGGPISLECLNDGLSEEKAGRQYLGSVIWSSVRPVTSKIDSHSSVRPLDFAVMYRQGGLGCQSAHAQENVQKFCNLQRSISLNIWILRPYISEV